VDPIRPPHPTIPNQPSSSILEVKNVMNKIMKTGTFTHISVTKKNINPAAALLKAG
jgi:hypothetical protein